jgi:hypothetical protein
MTVTALEETGLPARAAVAIQLAMQDGHRAGEQLESYVEDLGDEGLGELQAAAIRLAHVITHIVARRNGR